MQKARRMVSSPKALPSGAWCAWCVCEMSARGKRTMGKYGRRYVWVGMNRVRMRLGRRYT